MIKYTFRDPCQKKCKVAMNEALTYQIFKDYLMINMNIFFEFMSVILKICMFKGDLSRFLKSASRFLKFFLVNGHL
jgi:hypothetical protein